ncbi:hypothetical protein [uncultured Shimia sp.]|uniref:hypothetical protein n=1 Tax=uncultured Shimia sp. TaxID=573152 RepID=UPI0025CDBF4C|nr:hypothetical protein [uncultured Shimia sp.]
MIQHSCKANCIVALPGKNFEMNLPKILNFLIFSFVLLLAACGTTSVPVPNFVPDPADGNVDFPDDSCLQNPLKTELQRDVSGMRFTISLDTYSPGEHAVQHYPRIVKLRIDAVSLPHDRPQEVRVDPSRIVLNEGGRRGKLYAYGGGLKQVDDLNATHLWARVDFEPVFDFPDRAQLIFKSGAIKLNGRDVPVGSINYDIVTHTERWSVSPTCGT